MIPEWAGMASFILTVLFICLGACGVLCYWYELRLRLVQALGYCRRGPSLFDLNEIPLEPVQTPEVARYFQGGRYNLLSESTDTSIFLEQGGRPGARRPRRDMDYVPESEVYPWRAPAETSRQRRDRDNICKVHTVRAPSEASKQETALHPEQGDTPEASRREIYRDCLYKIQTERAPSEASQQETELHPEQGDTLEASQQETGIHPEQGDRPEASGQETGIHPEQDDESEASLQERPRSYLCEVEPAKVRYRDYLHKIREGRTPEEAAEESDETRF